MATSQKSPSVSRLKLNTKKRPESLKIELLNVPENRFSFASRSEGSNPHIGFKDISYTVREGIFRRKSRTILNQINGEFAAKELTAIMGPSGSGKSCLMNILAGYTNSGVTGQKLLNDDIRNDSSFRKNSCYIMQDDHLQPLLTVKESMIIAANLKLDTKYLSEKKNITIKYILEEIGLWNERYTRTCNLSGGQKKRLSIGLELLENPQFIFLDEPTSGLDSSSSKQCVMLLKKLASSGRTVICTIHQPSSLVFEMFDHLYVLAKGKCLYQGSIKGLLPCLEQCGLVCPNYHNPADFVLEVASGEHGENVVESLVNQSEIGLRNEWRKRQRNSLQFQTMEHIDRLMKEEHRITPVSVPNLPFPSKNYNKKPEMSKTCHNPYTTSFLKQLSVLLKRTFLILSRDRTLTYSRILTHTAIAFFIGSLFFGIGQEASNMLNNFKFMYFSVMFLMLTAFNCVSTTFPLELPIITREHFNKWYSLRAYYLAISLADTPVQIFATCIYAVVTYFCTKQPMECYRFALFLFMCILVSLVAQSFGLLIGACMDIKNGVIFGPFCFLPFTIFSGFFVQLHDAHPFLRWIFHISFLKYGLEGVVLSVLGYDRAKLPCEAEFCIFRDPKEFLDQYDMLYSKYSTGVVFLVCLVIILRIAAYYALSIQIRHNRSRRK